MTQRKEDDPPTIALADVIDFEQARVRREVDARHGSEEPERATDDGPEAPDGAERDAERELERHRADETARWDAIRRARARVARVAEAEARFQLRVADRLARIHAEGDAQIARMRLAFAERDRYRPRQAWLIPALLVVMLAVVGSLGLGFGIRIGRRSAASFGVPGAAAPDATKPGRVRVRPSSPRCSNRATQPPAKHAPKPTVGPHHRAKQGPRRRPVSVRHPRPRAPLSGLVEPMGRAVCAQG